MQLLMAMSAFSLWLILQLRRDHKALIAYINQLTKEIRKMADDVIISQQSLDDLKNADTALQATVSNVLTYISSKLGSIPPDDSTQVAAVVADIQGTIASLQASIAPAPPTPTPAPTPDAVA